MRESNLPDGTQLLRNKIHLCHHQRPFFNGLCIPVPSWWITVLEQWFTVDWWELPFQGLILSSSSLPTFSSWVQMQCTPLLHTHVLQLPSTVPESRYWAVRRSYFSHSPELLSLSSSLEVALTVVLMKLMGVRNQRVPMSGAKMDPSIILRAFQS